MPSKPPDVDPAPIAGWPTSQALAGQMTSETPAACTTRMPTEVPRDYMPVLVDLMQRSDIPGGTLWELAVVADRSGLRRLSPWGFERLWRAGIKCGAMLPVFLLGHENSTGPSGTFAGATEVAYIESWRECRYTLAHAMWHIANGEPDPFSLKQHPVRGCTPDAFATVWALSGRNAETDATLAACLHWMRLVHPRGQ